MSVRKGQVRLGKIAKQLESNSPISDDDRLFLSSALKEISDGRNAEVALGVNAKRGERKSRHARQTKYTLPFVFGWIASAIQPRNKGGLGLSLNEACKKISKITLPHLRLSTQTIRRYWDKHKSNYKPHFTLPAD
mgnify:CR=1 FL=1